MITYVIIHGITGYAGIHWQQWLHDELISKKHNVIMPTFPNPDRPDRETWRNTLTSLMENIDSSETVIITHSLGAPTALDYLEQTDRKIHGLITVSGFFEVLNSELNDYFMKEKSIDMSKVRENTKKAVVIYGDDDPYVPQKNLKALADELYVKPIVIKKGGHLNTRSGYTEFPLLLEQTLQI